MNSISLSNKVLPYEMNEYQAFYEDEFITGFSHALLATGVTDPEEAKKIVDMLNARQEKKNISFNAEMLAGNQLTGGSCSAIALRVAKGALDLIDMLQKRNDLSEFNKDTILINKLRALVDEINAEATTKNKKYDLLRKHTRSIQQAFNTITVNRELQTAHAVQDKMNALSSFFDLKITRSTPELKVCGNENIESEFTQQIQNLETGVYLLRIIDYKFNHKLENQGHTITYIKTPLSELYFDPALGFYNLFSSIQKTNLVFNALLSAKSRFKVDQMSFHLLDRRETPQPSSPKMEEEAEIESILKRLEDPNPDLIAHAFDVAFQVERKGNKALADEIRKKAISFISAYSPEEYRAITPPLSGPYSVGIKRYYLEDASRKEVNLEHPSNYTRRLEIDVHYPGMKGSESQYKTLTLVEGEKIVSSHALCRSQPTLKPAEGKKFPVIIFSPGLGNSPDDYTHLVEEMASHGFCVISINHPYSGLFTRFLGNHQQKLKRMSEESIIREGLFKTDDIVFLVQEIKNGTITGFHEFLADRININSIGVIGHSLGGSAAIRACKLSKHIKAAIDLDGRIIQEPDAMNIEKPVLIMVADHETEERQKFEEALEACKRQSPSLSRINISARHGDFFLAPFYRRNGVKDLTQNFIDLSKEVNKNIMAFFREKLT